MYICTGLLICIVTEILFLDSPIKCKQFDVSASSSYFECGHGKGPCDGIGGTAKRIADMSVKQGKYIIQDATDFYQNVSKYHQSAVYKFVSANKVQFALEEVVSINTQITPLNNESTLR